jgi:hypothetical protein
MDRFQTLLFKFNLRRYTLERANARAEAEDHIRRRLRRGSKQHNDEVAVSEAEAYTRSHVSST